MKKCDILIIEDDTDDLEILSEALQESGIDCLHYEDSLSKAFAYLKDITYRDELPKLIITDFYLRGKTGIELIAELRKVEAYKDIPVIVLSSQRHQKDIDKYREMGAAEYLVKPSTYQEYLQMANYLKTKMETAIK